MSKYYLQLYSLHNEIQKDFDGVIRRVKQMGYTGVEFAGIYGGYSAADLKAFLAEVGLEPLSAHIGVAGVMEHLEYAAELGMKYFIDPAYGMETREDALKAAAEFNKAGELCAKAGIQFGYHNHQFEFKPCEDGTLMDTLILNTDPNLVCFQLDAGWAAYAGIDCPAFIAKYPGRFKLIHFKECSFLHADDPESEWNGPAGKGIVNWTAVRDAAFAQGTEAFIVEREAVYAGDIFSSVQDDGEYLKSLLQ